MRKTKRIIISLFVIVSVTLMLMIGYSSEPMTTTEVLLSNEKMNYTLPNNSPFDVDGNLVVPFDIAFPEAFANGEREYEKTSISIKLDASHSGKLSARMNMIGITRLTKMFGDEKATWYEATLEKDKDVVEVIKHIRKLDEVLVADYNYITKSEAIVSDETYVNEGDYQIDFSLDAISENPRVGEQWYLSRYGIPEAWEWMNNHETYEGGAGGTPDVVVAVIDTGVDYDHPDLKANIWVNPNEEENNSDSDDNGYPDDIYGVNVVDPNRSSMDDHGHGTHVAGIIAAANNKEGIVGIAYNVKIMPIKAGQASGFFTANDIAEGIYYAYIHGADVINMSFGGSIESIAVQDALMKAYTRSVLVAAAGNSGLPNEYCAPFPLVGPSFPAAYSYVLGVMSVGPSNQESTFSNWDCKAFNSREYEVNAPGESMLSTLPNGQYVSWNGTSMAAPVVSGIAALVRSVYNDRDIYPNKFVMGQISATANEAATGLPNRPLHNIPPIVNALEALSSLPKPDVQFYDYLIYDKVEYDSENNNGDGVIDAGETLYLGVTLRNRWGKSGNTMVTIDTLTPIGDPLHEDQESYVTIEKDTVDFREVGTYSTRDNYLRDDSIVLGVDDPFILKVSKDAPNDYIVRLNITGTFTNAIDLTDETEYSFDGEILLKVRSGYIVERRITSDQVWTKDNYYIIPDNTIIEEGVTVRVEPGTNIQFWSDDPNDAYADSALTALTVNGNFIVEGSIEEPVNIFPSQLRSVYRVSIREGIDQNYQKLGYISISYAKITNPYLSVSYLGYSTLTQERLESSYAYRYLYNGKIETRYWESGRISSSYAEFNEFNVLYGVNIGGTFDTNIFRECAITYSGAFTNNVFLLNNTLRYNRSYSGNFYRYSSGFQYNTIREHYDKESGVYYSMIEIPYSVFGGEAKLEYYSRIAKELGGHLFSPNSQEELEMINNMILHSGGQSIDWDFWYKAYYEYISQGNLITDFESNLRDKNLFLGMIERDDKLYYDDGTEVDQNLFDFELDGKSLDENYVLYMDHNREFALGKYSQSRYLIIEYHDVIYSDEIYLSEDHVQMDMESKYQITPSLNPTTADINTLIYHSDDEGVVIVDENGLVSPVGYGNAVVYVYSEDYNVVSEIKIDVVEKVQLESIELSLTNTQLSIGQTYMLTTTYMPLNTTERFVTYESSDDSIVEVSNTGSIKANGVGTATITVYSEANGITDTLEITVVAPVTGIEFSTTVFNTNLTKDDEQSSYMPNIYPSDATNQNLIWRSSNPEVAYVNENNELIKLKEGVATLVATVENTNFSAELIVSISETYTPSRIVKLFDDIQSGYIIALDDNGDMYYWGSSVTSPKKVQFIDQDTNNIELKVHDFALNGNDILIYSHEKSFEVGSFNKNEGVISYYSDASTRRGYSFRGSYKKDFDQFNGTELIKITNTGYGQSYSMLFDDGSVFGAGENGNGQLGDGTNAFRQTPVQTNINQVVDISSVYHGFYYLLDNGDLYVTGGSDEKYSIPEKVMENVRSIEQSMFSTYDFYTTIITNDGDLYRASNEYPNNSTYIHGIGNLVNLENEFEKAYVYRQNLIGIKEGNVFVTGENSYGELALGYDGQTQMLTMLELNNVTEIFVAYQTVYYQTADNRFFASGKNNRGQLGNFSNEDSNELVEIFLGLKGNDQGFIVEDDGMSEIITENFTTINFNSGYYYNHNRATLDFEYLDTEEGNILTFEVIATTDQRFRIGINYPGQTWMATYNNFYGTGTNQTITLDISGLDEQTRNDYTLLSIQNLSELDGSIQIVSIEGIASHEGVWRQTNDEGVEIIQENAPEYTLYGNQIILDYNEALLFGTERPFIKLTNSKGQIIAINNYINLDQLVIQPFNHLIVGETYSIVVPSNALTTKFMVSNERFIRSFTYGGDIDPNTLSENERNFIDLIKQIDSLGETLDDIEFAYNPNTYNIAISALTEDYSASLLEYFGDLGMTTLVFGETIIENYLVDQDEILKIIREALLNGEDQEFELQFRAQILLSNDEGISKNFKLVITFTDETLYNQIILDAINMEMQLISNTHEDGSTRHMVSDPIVLEFNSALQGDVFDQIQVLDHTGTAIEVSVTLEANTLTISPVNNLSEGTNYSLVIPQGALLDELENTNDLLTYNFKTYEPIEILRTSVSDSAENVNTLQEFRLFFNYFSDELGDEILLLNEAGEAISITVVQTDNYSVLIKPTSPLEEGHNYKLVVPEGRYKDELGVLSGLTEINFSTYQSKTRFYFNHDYLYDLSEQLEKEGLFAGNFYNNVILNNFNETNVDYWARFTASEGSNNVFAIENTYFGTTNEMIIEKHFIDYDDFPSLGDYVSRNTLMVAPENTFPFVTSVEIYDAEGNQNPYYGNEIITVVITFNRDMETSVPLDVRFGSSLPYAEYMLEGEYTDARTWVAQYELKSFIEGGNQYWNISNGHAAGSPHLRLGWDVKRFTFLYDSSEALALTMQATAVESGIELNWVQDDYDTFAGYNIYRSTSENGNYIKLNEYMLPYDNNSFTDYDVQPGQVYYYYFTVALTSFDQNGNLIESEPSGKVSVRAYDTLEPTIVHTRIYETYAERNLLISAVIVDNVTVTQAKVYYRTTGSEEYQSITMAALNNRFTALISAQYVTTDGVEYYIEAFDGINYQYFGSADEPIQVVVKELVNENAKGDVNADGEINVLDALIILRAHLGLITLNEDEMLRADLNGDGSLSTLEAMIVLQYAVGTRTTLDVND